MRWLALLPLALLACGETPKPPAAPPPPSLRDTASWLVDRIGEQEARKDATCWTTVRMMDSFSAQKPLTAQATLLKIEAHRTLVYRLWRAASTGPTVDAAAVTKAAPQLDEPSAQQLTDHQKITENWRTLLSIVSDAIAHRGLFAARAPDVAALTPEGAEALAALSTRISLALLAEASRSAKGSHIDLPALKVAYGALSARLGLIAAEGAPPTSAAPDAIDFLRELTRRTINRKVRALQAWNRAADKDLEFVNRFGGRFTAEGLAALRQKLLDAARMAARGLAPQRVDTELDSLRLFARAPDQRAIRAPYLDLPWVANATDQLFPHRTLTNGDVVVESAFDFGPEHIKHKLQLHFSDLDATRDTALHWRLMAEAWRELDAAPAGPFAAELLAERLSELILFHVILHQQVAYRAGARVDRAFVHEPPFRNLLFLTDRATGAAVGEAAADWDPALDTKATAELQRYEGPFFEEVTDSGLPKTPALRYQRGGAGPFRMHDKMGAGIAVGDVDADGLPDLFLAGEGGNRLFRNLGERRFEDITARSKIADTELADARHPLLVDLDGDGRLDLVTIHSRSASRIWRQTGSGTFDASPLATGPGAHCVVAFDFDRDGDLDLFVGHYASRTAEGNEYPSLDGRNGNPNQLFRNEGQLRFTEVGVAAGLASPAWTLAATAFDADHDGDLDLYVANDFGADQLFVNEGPDAPTRFTDASARLGVDDRGSGMNASLVDIDRDGRLDLYVSTIDTFSKNLTFRFPQDRDLMPLDQRILDTTLYLSGNKLLRNAGARFTPVESARIQPGPNGWSWGALFFDYDNDGDQDLYLANGWVSGTAADRERNHLLINLGAHLVRTARPSPEAYEGNTRGAVAVDLTGTGVVDLVTNDFDAAPRVFANRHPPGRFLKLRLKGKGANPMGIGARVRVLVEGAPPSTRERSAGSAYLAQQDPLLHFGLGAAEAATGIEIRWPDGALQKLPGPHNAGLTVNVVQP